VVALYMTLVGYGVMVGIPVISTAWVELLGFTEAQVGRVAGADLGGLALGSVLSSLVMARWNRRWLALSGLLIAVLANGLCTHYTDYETVLWLRVLAGVGSGIFTSVAVTTLGGTRKPARAYNFMLFAFAFSQAAEMQVLPMLSMDGIYWVFIGLFLLSAPFLRYLPSKPSAKQPSADTEILAHPKPRPFVAWLCLAAIFFTYINIGTYWTYIELASLSSGVDGEWVGRVLVFASLGGMVGCFVATLISNRFGLAKPLLVSLVCMVTIVALLAFGINQPALLISICSFNLLWIFIDVYQMGTVAVIDRAGSFAALMPGAQGLGQIVGPNIAASLLAAEAGYSPVFAMCAMAAAIGMLIYGFMYIKVRQHVPELIRQG
jgi:predicted MFS family arabinose efflux permease